MKLDEISSAELYADPCLSLDIPKIIFEPYVRQLDWAPIENFHPCRGLLAILLTDGNLYLYQWSNEDVLSFVGDLCSDVIHVLMESWNTLLTSSNPIELFQEFKSRVYQTKITGFCWGRNFLKNNSPWLTLFTVTQTGLVMVWKVKFDSKIDISFHGSVTSGFDPATSIIVNQHTPTEALVIVGEAMGQLKAIPIDLSRGVTSSSSTLIWAEKDRLEFLPRAAVLFSSPPNLILVVAKLSTIHAFNLSSTGEVIYSDVFQTDDIMVVGLDQLPDTRILALTRGGTHYVISTHTEEDRFLFSKLSLENSERKYNFPPDNYCCQGFVLSPSKTLAIFAFRINSFFDPYIIRETTTLSWCTTNFSDPLALITNNSSTDLSYLWDCFEALRITNLKESKDLLAQASKSTWLSMDLKEFKKQIWFSHINSCSVVPAEETKKLECHFITETLLHIFQTKYVMQRIHNIIQKKGTGLSNLDKLSYPYLLLWLRSYHKMSINENQVPTCSIANQVKEFLKSPECLPSRDLSLKVGIGTCYICSAFLARHANYRYVVCENNHELPICNLTLAPVDISVPHFYCILCKAVVLSEAVEEIQSICVLCDYPLRTYAHLK